jgi:glycosidase
MRWDGTPMGGFTTGRPWFRLSRAPADGNVAAQSADPGSLLSRYRELLRVRKASAALATGSLALVPRAQGSPVVAWVRQAGDERVLVVHTLSGSPAEAGPLAAPGTAAETLLAAPGAALERAGDGWRARLPPHGSGVWRLR